MSAKITYDQIVTEVAREMGVEEPLIERAKRWAEMTAMHGRRIANTELDDDVAHIVRMYFRALLWRMIHDPEYRLAMRREIQRQVERN